MNRDYLGVVHETIDDHTTVTDLVKTRIEQRVDR